MNYSLNSLSINSIKISSVSQHDNPRMFVLENAKWKENQYYLNYLRNLIAFASLRREKEDKIVLWIHHKLIYVKYQIPKRINLTEWHCIE